MSVRRGRPLLGLALILAGARPARPPAEPQGCRVADPPAAPLLLLLLAWRRRALSR